jgi:outer membrane protein assembly factor BamB
MSIALTAQAGRWICGSGIGLLAISLVLRAAAQIDANGLGSADDATAATPFDQLPKNWPNFRGPGGYGHAAPGSPPLEWSVDQDRNVLWKTVVPKHGVSSPIVWDRRLFLTGADDLAREIYCFSTDTGELLWQHEVKDIPGSPEDTLPRVMEDAGFAAPTPTTNGRYVAAIFATGELVCVSVTGDRVWAKHLGIPRNHYGHASSLITHGGLVIVQYDQNEGSQLLAFDLASGDPAWRVERASISWSSPILVDNNGRMELILANSKAVDSYDPNTGKRLWHVECLDGEVAPSAAYADGVLFVANEYASASTIDISNHASQPKILWQWDEALPDAPSLVANDRFLIVPTGFGVVSCIDVKNGKMVWQHEFEEGFYSSPILANGRVYLCDSSGRMQIFRIDDEFELLGVSDVGEGVYATPAFVGDRIYVRGLTHLFCIEADGE